MSAINYGCDFDLGWLNRVNVNSNAVNNTATELVASRLSAVTDEYRAAWLLRAITFIDLTTLGGDDTESNVTRLCLKAAKPLANDLLEELDYLYDCYDSIRTAAVCVYPSKVKVAANTLRKLKLSDKINVASVATGFPSGQMPLSSRLEEIKYAVREGATEIDIVLDRSLVLTGEWEQLYMEIKLMKETCGPGVHMKSILAAGELDTLNNVYKASLVAMMAGSDFIKTSTGKEAVNATIPIGIVMARAIREFHDKTGYKVGLKPAGGIRTSKDAISWMILVKEILDDSWLDNNLFRFGASGLLSNIEYDLYHYITGYYPAPYEFTLG